MAVTSAPEIIVGRIDPMSETKKFSAMRSGYFLSTLPGASPLARAVTTYCFCNSSSRLARSVRTMPAVPAVPMITTGIQMCDRIERNLSQLIASPRNCWSIRLPIDTPNQMLAKYIITSASMKLGTAMPARPINVSP